MSRSFSHALILRVVALAALLGGAAWMTVSPTLRWLAVLPLIGALILTAGLIHYVTDTNRRLTRFFEGVRYSDFAIRFSSSKEKGDSFEAVNRQFNEVLEAFRQTRAEKEANLLFLNTIVQHLGTGVLAFDRQNNILLSNNAAFQTLGVYRLHHLHELPPRHAALQEFAQNLTTKGKILYQAEPGRQLAVQGVALNLQGRAVRLLTLQNIHPELQRKELDAWRDLTRVLRHEIMNSVTPIVSLVETMQDILPRDEQQAAPSRADLADLAEALEVVGSRSRALMDFVQAYRSFSAIPEPKPESIPARRLLDHIVQLFNANQRSDQAIRIEAFVAPEELVIEADAGQIEMVLLNLVKNAREALQSTEQPDKRITLRAGNDDKGKAFIEVDDNGPGIAPDLLDEIFIPFFTTKTSGTGVGLSISRQIMQLHGGNIRVSSTLGSGTRFVLAF